MSLGEAVRSARTALALLDAGASGAAQSLDCVLLQAIVIWIREPSPDRDALEDALAESIERAEAPWHARWAVLMDILRVASRTPSFPESLDGGGTAWRIMYQLRKGPARIRDLAKVLDVNPGCIATEAQRRSFPPNSPQCSTSWPSTSLAPS